MYTITVKLHSLESDPELRKKQQEEFVKHDLELSERVENLQLVKGRIIKSREVKEGFEVEVLGN